MENISAFMKMFHYSRILFLVVGKENKTTIFFKKRFDRTKKKK